MNHVNNCAIMTIQPKHEAIIEHMVAHPDQSQREIACFFGVSAQYIGMLIHNDLFQVRLRERRDELFSSTSEPIARKLEALAHLTIERLSDAVENSEDPEFLRKSADTVLNRMGLGAKTQVVPFAVPGAQAQENNAASRAAIEAAVRARRLLASAEERASAIDGEFSEVAE